MNFAVLELPCDNACDRFADHSRQVRQVVGPPGQSPWPAPSEALGKAARLRLVDIITYTKCLPK